MGREKEPESRDGSGVKATKGLASSGRWEKGTRGEKKDYDCRAGKNSASNEPWFVAPEAKPALVVKSGDRPSFLYHTREKEGHIKPGQQPKEKGSLQKLANPAIGRKKKKTAG